ncbi:hypothetical protein A6E13_04985 [Aliivibrio fischeri]|uniref:helix-turn-helix domain-containing protein n=1 Tax=Aliivibrio fischeri TaxID=668 RepID=UPI00080DE36A|nr:helix-turn-helix domain-containing protein [Aliivibrio fischeri]OCH03655.1 hypothetical protein A6E09_05810 [Aliivibrio fischeri]OCH30560.1 hypothetical protein A6E13_04985 [Aliivibrio fischeri]
MQKLETQFDITKKILSLNPKEFSLTPTEKFVLVQLSHYFGDKKRTGHFSCYPRQARLASETGYARATVLNALKKCEELGFISSNFRVSSSGDPTSKLYHWKGIPKQPDEDKESQMTIEVAETMASSTHTINDVSSITHTTRIVESSDISLMLAEEESPF